MVLFGSIHVVPITVDSLRFLAFEWLTNVVQKKVKTQGNRPGLKATLNRFRYAIGMESETDRFAGHRFGCRCCGKTRSDENSRVQETATTGHRVVWLRARRRKNAMDQKTACMAWEKD